MQNINEEEAKTARPKVKFMIDCYFLEPDIVYWPVKAYNKGFLLQNRDELHIPGAQLLLKDANGIQTAYELLCANYYT